MSDRSDDEILDVLRAAVEEHLQPSEGFVDLVMAGYDLTTDDMVIAELTQDTDLDPESVPVRGSDLGARLLTFASEDVSFEFEVGHTAPEVIGFVNPPSGLLKIEQDGRSTPVPVDEAGAFECSLTSSSPFRLRFTPTDGPMIATGWIVP